MKKTVFEVYELYVEVPKKGEAAHTLTAEAAKEALANAFMDDEKPRRECDTAAEASEFIKEQGPGRIDDFGHYWRVHGWISFEVDQTVEDGEITDWQSIGSTAVSGFETV